MSQEQLTPAEQTLMNFLDKLAVSPVTHELLTEGYSALDEAVEENQRLQDSIATAANAMRDAKKTS